MSSASLHLSTSHGLDSSSFRRQATLPSLQSLYPSLVVPSNICSSRHIRPARHTQRHTTLQNPAHLRPVSMTLAVEQKSVAGTMAALKAKGKVALIPFLVAGDPDLETTEKALRLLDENGADVIELGVPYSDPLADGPVIQNAGTRALARGATLDKVMDLVRRVAPALRAPLVLFTYYNPIRAKGLERYCKELKAAGAAGLLVPDLPLEAAQAEVRPATQAAGIELVLLTTPTTPRERMTRIAHASQGFVYLVSVTGVTGARVSMEGRVQGLIDMLHAATNKPVAVGFGVSGPEQARQIASWGAEGVIVGSALVRALSEAPTPEEGLQNMVALLKSLRAAIN